MNNNENERDRILEELGNAFDDGYNNGVIDLLESMLAIIRISNGDYITETELKELLALRKGQVNIPPPEAEC